jgi:glycosyltransferase involved in cell wall biosynthesis
VTVDLAAVILTRNEGKNIADCLGSLAWADRCVVFDSGSEDQTVQIALQCGARVLHHPFENFCSQRNAALSSVEARWIFFVDADERATPALADEVWRVIHYDDTHARAGWWVPRQNIMIGHRMRGGGWYPDPQLRLLRRGMAHYDPRRPVHETVILDGLAGTLENSLIHHNYDSVAQFRRKMLSYTTLEAQILDQSGVQVRPWTYATMPVREFWRRFVKLDGYRDHLFGLLFCGLMGWYTFVSYRKLREIRGPSKG